MFLIQYLFFLWLVLLAPTFVYFVWLVAMVVGAMSANNKIKECNKKITIYKMKLNFQIYLIKLLKFYWDMPVYNFLLKFSFYLLSFCCSLILYLVFSICWTECKVESMPIEHKSESRSLWNLNLPYVCIYQELCYCLPFYYFMQLDTGVRV